MSKPEKAFEIQIDGQDYPLELGKCAVVLFRKKQEVDYVMIDRPEGMIRGFNNADMCRWIGGYLIDVDEDGDLVRRTTTFNDQTFRELYDWNPITIEKETPTESEEQGFIDVVTRDLSSDWEGQSG